MPAPIRLLLIDDHEIVREGLATILGRESDFQLVASAASGELGLELLEQVAVDVAVVDYSLPGVSGVEVCERIVATQPQVSVVILTTYLEDEVLLGAVRAGAKAYVVKDIEAERLKDAIRTVASGHSVLDPQVAGRLMSWAGNGVLKNRGKLSHREVEVLRRVALGRTNQQIADELFLGLSTIKTYVSRVMEKLDCTTRSEAAARAAKWGLI
jgi:DNA-binding NarL/FixJ family response regulator